MKPLFPHQRKALDMLRQSLATGHRRPLLQAPTGAGKTRLAAEIINLGTAKAKANGGTFPCIFVVPRIQLINQTVKAFYAEGIHDIGVLQGNHPLRRPGAMVQVASVQTLPNRRIPPARLVIVDEAHMRSDWLWRQMGEDGQWASIPVIGLSATPWTAGLGKHFDDLLVPATMADLIPTYLAPFRMYAPSHPDLSAVRVVAGDYRDDDLSQVMSASGLVADAVQTWLAKGEDRPTLCFAVDRAHAQKLCRKFNEAGVTAEYADAFTRGEERDRIGERLRTGQTKVLCNVGIATTGVDWPWVSCISYCRPTKSESLWVQIVGRGLRKYPGKTDCIVLDHTDTALNLGLPTDIHYERLDDGKADKSGKRKKKDKAPTPKECPSCGALKPPGVHKCPSCGFAPVKQSEIEFADGELHEYRRGPEEKDGPPQAERQRWFAMLLHEGMNRGYKPGWPYRAYAEKFGYPPGRDIDRGCQPIPPDPAVRNWIRSRLIAYAKGREKGRAA